MMARPRKDSREPGARERIIAAFWGLLEDMSFQEIGIKAIVAKAKCNRATFYYHFDSSRDLFEKAIKEEIVGPDGVPWPPRILLSGREIPASISDRFEVSMHRLDLAMCGGGMDTVQRIVVDRMMEIWAEMLDCREEDLKESARMVIRYGVCGTMGFLFFTGESQGTTMRDIPWDFAEETANRLIESVCKEQGASIDKVRARLLSLEAEAGLS